MTESAFYTLGRITGAQLRKAKWLWQSVAGSEADAIHAEQRVGRDMAAVVLEETPRGVDQAVQALLDEIGGTLTPLVRNRLHRFQMTAVCPNEPTAFALPGGFIFVAQSLVQLCNGERDELAFVLAHEMAHVIRRHAMDRLLQQKAASVLALASPARGALASWVRQVGFQGLARAYSRDQEFEADELGFRLMRAAGFNAGGAIRLLERFRPFAATPDPFSIAPYFSTHPSVDDRVLRIRHLGG
jgi:predicted Zn-dependent protease